jgi:pimeloyl-ACP methyl ester carboxylesterase
MPLSRKFLASLCLLLALIAIASLPTRATGVKRSVTFTTSDGIKIGADLTLPGQSAGSTTVVLLHMLGGSRADYTGVASALLSKGFNVASMDFPGHGESQVGAGGTALNRQSFTNADYMKYPADVKQFIQHLKSMPEIAGRQLAIVGASIGADSAIMVGADDPAVKALVLLSPGLDYRGIQPSSYFQRLGRPALLIAAKDDAYSADSVSKLKALAPGSTVSQVYETGGHGTSLLASHPELTNNIANWLKQAFQGVRK